MVREPDGHGHRADGDPHDEGGAEGVPHGAIRQRRNLAGKSVIDGRVHSRKVYFLPNIFFMFYREDDGEESVEAHEYERVDADVAGGVDEVLDGLAPDQAEGPVVQDVVGGGGGDAEDDEEEVGQGQVQDQHVGRVAHLLVGRHHRDHQRVADDP